MAPAIDWTQYEQLKAHGLADREIARRWGIPWGTFHRKKQKREGPRSTVHRPPSTVDRLLADIRTTLAAELQPLRSRLEALETAIAIWPGGEAPLTVHGQP